MRRNFKAGSTGITLPVNVINSSTGAGLGSLVYNTGSLVAEYRREGASSATPITLVTATLGTWVSGGFIADGSRGLYELGVPNAAVAAAAGVKWVRVSLYGAANMTDTHIEIQLDAVDNQDAAGFGMSRLDAAITTRSTYAGGTVLGVTNPVSVATTSIQLIRAEMDSNSTQLAAILSRANALPTAIQLRQTVLGAPRDMRGVTSGWTFEDGLHAALGTRYWPEASTGEAGDETGTFICYAVDGETILQSFITDLDASGTPTIRRLV